MRYACSWPRARKRSSPAIAEFEPSLVICPFLKDRVPAEVWQRYRTIIIHPGPPGDRGPSSLDWAITDGETSWGVTALQAVEEMDAGPIWGYRTFPLPANPPRKSSLYNGAVTQAAIELVHEVVAKAADRAFRPRELNYSDPGRPRRATPADAPVRPHVLLGRLRPPPSSAGSGPRTAHPACGPPSTAPPSRCSTPTPGPR